MCTYQDIGMHVNIQTRTIRIVSLWNQNRSNKMFYMNMSWSILDLVCSKNGKTAAILYKKVISASESKFFVKIVNLDKYGLSVDQMRRFTILETEILGFEKLGFDLQDPLQCSNILYDDYFVISCSKNKDNLIFYRKYQF